jgi:Tfp pilus assembly protein PilN
MKPIPEPDTPWVLVGLGSVLTLCAQALLWLLYVMWSTPWVLWS